ncbi:OLC1v1030657C1 [Oldenlandia corymbosa var. corymbosa]|uniref:OLC1v1030657C1 n=1 Tax=Oldenlandia corymbosa var. corymbosa TaxID=529605 RepID=A0AAV1CHP4_OLDCO|nr:OLC1v1030657C1 [Oldenlandia corymbosa var. corymbosa]
MAGDALQFSYGLEAVSQLFNWEVLSEQLELPFGQFIGQKVVINYWEAYESFLDEGNFPSPAVNPTESVGFDGVSSELDSDSACLDDISEKYDDEIGESCLEFGLLFDDGADLHYPDCSFIKGSCQSFDVIDPGGNDDIRWKLFDVEPDESGKKSLLSMNALLCKNWVEKTTSFRGSTEVCLAAMIDRFLHAKCAALWVLKSITPYGGFECSRGVLHSDGEKHLSWSEVVNCFRGGTSEWFQFEGLNNPAATCVGVLFDSSVCWPDLPVGAVFANEVLVRSWILQAVGPAELIGVVLRVSSTDKSLNSHFVTIVAVMQLDFVVVILFVVAVQKIGLCANYCYVLSSESVFDKTVFRGGLCHELGTLTPQFRSVAIYL